MIKRVLSIAGLMCPLLIALSGYAQVREETAAKVGELLGAQILIRGAITMFEEKASKGGIGGISLPGGFGGGLSISKAKVGMDIRMYDTTKGVVLQSHNVEKSATKKGIAVAGGAGGVGLAGGWETKTPLGEATRNAIEEIVKLIVKETEQIPWQGSIVKVEGKKIYLNAGSDSEIKEGTTFEVYRPGEELVDPETGLSLGSEEEKAGQIKVVQVKGKFSVAEVITGSDFQRKDIIRFIGDAKKYTPKKRIAVAGFECKVPSASWDIGSGMSDMLTTALVKTGKFIVVEREALDDILKEQALGTPVSTKPAAVKVAEPSSSVVKEEETYPEPVYPTGGSASMSFGGGLLASMASLVFSYTFSAGGYWLGTNPYQPGEWTKWKMGVGNDIQEMEKAFLTRTKEKKEWWRVSMTTPGDKKKTKAEEMIFEGLFLEGQTSLRRLKGKFPDQEPGEIPVTEGSTYIAPTQLTQESIEGAIVGEETITLAAGKFVTKHAIYKMMGAGSSEWWLNNSIPGGVVKYLYKTPQGKIEYVAELTGYGKDATTKLNSY